MYILVLLLPFLSFIISTGLGRWSGRKGSELMTITFMGCTVIIAALIFSDVFIGKTEVNIYLGDWISIDYLSIIYDLKFDGLTATMLLVVSFISTFVHIYSIEYMHHDNHLQRFLGLLSLFTFFMIWLVTSSSLILLFIGWEGIGVVSYLLVNFWYTRLAANRAAMMALLTNRIGDWGYSLGMFALIGVIGSLDFQTWFSVAWGYNNYISEIITIALVIGVIGKSSQIGLHTWLPFAMEGPTPVSALLHAATLVTAGVFLLLRISPVLEFAPFTLTTLTFLGGLTAFLGGSLGLVANDMKKVIAYSTMSQLGYMIYAIGISAYSVSLYHLVNHAFFKALLFLSAGSVIHALSDEQDLRKMGGLRNILPFTYQMMFIGSISLMGIPYTSGFYSKEVILTLGYSSESLFAGIGYWLCSISALFTAIYSFRLITTGFLVNSNISNKNLLKSSHEPGSAIIIVLTTLAITSLTVGYSLSSLFANNSDLFDDFIFNLPVNYKTSTYLGGALYPLFLTIFGGLLFYIIYMYYNHMVLYLKLTAPGKFIYNLLNSRYYFDIFYSQLTKSFIKISLYLSKELDKGLGEFLGPTGLYYGLHQNPKIDNLYGFKKPGSHFITDKSPILYGGYIILSLLLTLISLAILSY